MIIEWTPRLSIGIEELDREHKAFFVLINHLGAAMARGCGTTELNGLTALLRAHADRHFSHEKAEMERYGYPDTRAHLAEHAEVYEMLEELADRVPNATVGLTVAFSQLLSDWLVNHVMTTDMKFAAWLSCQPTAASQVRSACS
jgi:hemerythrin-like metal-binding protein